MSLTEEKPLGHSLYVNLIYEMQKASDNRYFDVIFIYANITKRQVVGRAYIRIYVRISVYGDRNFKFTGCRTGVQIGHTG